MKRWLMLCAALWTAPALAADVPPVDAGRHLIETTVEELRTALSDDPAASSGEHPEAVIALIEKHVLPHVDTRMSGRMILCRHWREATPEQRERFIDGYRDLLLRTYATHATDYLTAKVDILSAALAGSTGKMLQVRTRVTRPGKPVAAVDYRLIARGTEWKVFDAVVQGISLVSTLRTAVSQEVQRYGMDGLNERLQAKIHDHALAPPAVGTY